MAKRAPDRGTAFRRRYSALLENLEQVIQGKRDVLQLALTCLLAEGHLLIEDVPGVGKTSLAKALAGSIRGTWQRIQFTPDLLPSDVTGVSVWNQAAKAFEFRAGPVFAHVVLADEINRASPRTQSALLEAMEERQVTVDARTYRLERPFMVLATQNPIEQEGTYALPEAQLDRFLMRIEIGYPDRDAAVDILGSHGGANPLDELEAVVEASEVVKMSQATLGVHVAPSLQGYIVDLVEATRRHRDLALGVSPRGTLALQRAARAYAAAEGRDYVVPDDLKTLAHPVLVHRMLLAPEAQLRDTSAADVLDEVLDSVPVPRSRPGR